MPSTRGSVWRKAVNSNHNRLSDQVGQQPPPARLSGLPSLSDGSRRTRTCNGAHARRVKGPVPSAIRSDSRTLVARFGHNRAARNAAIDGGAQRSRVRETRVPFDISRVRSPALCPLELRKIHPASSLEALDGPQRSPCEACRVDNLLACPSVAYACGA